MVFLKFMLTFLISELRFLSQMILLHFIIFKILFSLFLGLIHACNQITNSLNFIINSSEFSIGRAAAFFKFLHKCLKLDFGHVFMFTKLIRIKHFIFTCFLIFNLIYDSLHYRNFLHLPLHISLHFFYYCAFSFHCFAFLFVSLC